MDTPHWLDHPQTTPILVGFGSSADTRTTVGFNGENFWRRITLVQLNRDTLLPTRATLQGLLLAGRRMMTTLVPLGCLKMFPISVLDDQRRLRPLSQKCKSLLGRGVQDYQPWER